MLVNVGRIEHALMETQEEIGKYRDPLSPEDEQARRLLSKRREILRRGLDLHNLVDLGNLVAEIHLPNWTVDPRVKGIPVELHDYLHPDCLEELSLVHHMQDEHGLWYRYRGQHGVVVCIRGLRHQALNSAWVVRAPNQFFLDTLVYQHDVGMGTFVFRSAPIFLPPRAEMPREWKTLYGQVHAYLVRHCDLSDGFLPWRHPEKFVKVFGLAEEGWWDK